MPQTINHDFSVSSSVNDDFTGRLEGLLNDMHLVRVTTTWPTSFHHRDDVVEVDYQNHGEPDTNALISECFECEECGQHQHHDSGRRFGADRGQLFCSETCSATYAESNGYYGVKYHGGRQWFQLGSTGGQLASYASENEHGFNVSEDHPFLIGFEVEKTDHEFFEMGGDLDVLTPSLKRDWIAVSDGSLCGDHGFELVSPAYNLTDDTVAFGRAEMEDTLEAFGLLNADSDSSCGGHITVSCHGLDGPELAQRLEPLFPVLFALYPQRVAGEYSQAVRGENATNTGRKFRAINTLHNRVEFRLFSAVQNGEQLSKRAAVLRETLRLIQGDSGILGVIESRDEITAALANVSSPLATAIRSLVGHGDNPAHDEMRANRISSFQHWYATGEMNETTRRYLR